MPNPGCLGQWDLGGLEVQGPRIAVSEENVVLSERRTSPG